MKKYISYLKYVVRHKYFVFKACKLTGCSIKRALLHDLSKFCPSEFFPYVDYFYNEDGTNNKNQTEEQKLAFDYAWNLHQKRNKHHWQNWVLLKDNGKEICLEIPEEYIKEMVADWIGAGQAITGKNDVYNWYQKSKNVIKMNNKSREKLEQLINLFK